MAGGYKIQALDANKMIALAFSQLYATLDAGSSWLNITPPSISVNDMHFVTPELGWAVSGQIILNTQNGGKTWTQKTATTTDRSLVSLSFGDPQLGFIGTNDGHLFRTTDGTNWAALETPLTGFVADICFSSRRTGWIAVSVRYPTFDEVAARAYRIWEDSGRPNNRDIDNWLSAERELRGQGGLLMSTDGGLNWSVLGAFSDVAQVVSVDDRTIFLLGQSPSKSGCLRSLDGGQTWDQTSGVDAAAIFFISKSIGWAVGYVHAFGQVARTSDGGQTWSATGLSSNAALDVHATDPRNVWVIAGSYGGPCVFRSRDGGLTWDAPQYLYNSPHI